MNDNQTVWGHLIDGSMIATRGGTLAEFDPATGEEGYRIARGTPADIADAVAAARAAQRSWADLRPILRGRVLSRIAEGLRSDRERFARIDRGETGRSLAVCLGEVELAAQYFEYYAGLVNIMGGEGIGLGADYHSYTRHEPYGVVGIITPWNSPLTQFARGVAPAVAVGNAVVAKPSEFTSAASVAFAEACAQDWGLPAGILNVVTGTGPEVGEAIALHPDIRMVAFTGSVRSGRRVAALAAERIIPVNLELGGKSANIVFEDANLDAAIRSSIIGFTANAGQLCSAGTRILVQAGIQERFVAGLKDALKSVRVGTSEGCSMGPIITSSQYEKVMQILDSAEADGIEVHRSGILEQDRGWFVPPTLLSGLSNDHPLARQEIFGPVAAIIPFEDDEEAVRLANDSAYGLVAGLWTASLSRAHRVAARLEAGQVFINEYFAGGVETPFGGYKQSGFGREKGIAALHHYCQLKTVTARL